MKEKQQKEQINHVIPKKKNIFRRISYRITHFFRKSTPKIPPKDYEKPEPIYANQLIIQHERIKSNQPKGQVLTHFLDPEQKKETELCHQKDSQYFDPPEQKQEPIYANHQVVQHEESKNNKQQPPNPKSHTSNRNEQNSQMTNNSQQLTTKKEIVYATLDLSRARAVQKSRNQEKTLYATILHAGIKTPQNAFNQEDHKQI